MACRFFPADGEWHSVVITAAGSTAMRWEDVLDLSPLRLKFISNAINKRRTLDKLSIFDAQAALIDEKSLSRLNAELRELDSD